MAQKVTVVLEDDLDGGQADETVRFGFDGADYEIDLSSANARVFRDQVAPFIEHAAWPAGDCPAGLPGPRRAGGAPATSAPGRKTTASPSAAAAGSRPEWPSSTTPRRPDAGPARDEHTLMPGAARPSIRSRRPRPSSRRHDMPPREPRSPKTT